MNIAFDMIHFTIRQCIYAICILLIGALLLHYATGFLNFKRRNYRTALEALFIGSIIAFFVSFIPYFGRILSLFVFLYLIKWFYKETWSKAFLAWIISIIIGFVIAIVVLTILDIPFLFIPKLT
jgi:hypothetical protein